MIKIVEKMIFNIISHFTNTDIIEDYTLQLFILLSFAPTYVYEFFMNNIFNN